MSKASVTKISCSERKWLEIHTKEFIFQKKRMSTGNSNFHMNAEVVLLLMTLFIIQKIPRSVCLCDVIRRYVLQIELIYAVHAYKLYMFKS